MVRFQPSEDWFLSNKIIFFEKLKKIKTVKTYKLSDKS
jgi:hypothetical protein